jgi:glycosyltransferase involved in cell wall biosynthesis
MRNAEMITVLMATRDRWAVLSSRSLASIKVQSRRPDQIVIVNDGQTFTRDQRGVICDIVTPTPVMVLENTRAPGVAGAWNTGLSYINDQGWEGYVAILDDDDEWDACHLEENETSTQEDDVSIVISGLRLALDGIEQDRQLIDRITDRDFLIGNPGWQGSNTFVRLSLLKQAGGFRDGMPSLNDRDLAIRLLRLVSSNVALIDQWTATWHINTNGTSLSSRRSPAKISGLKWFWQIYGNEMTVVEADAFFDRADRLFGVGRNDCKICKKRLAHGRPLLHVVSADLTTNNAHSASAHCTALRIEPFTDK